MIAELVNHLWQSTAFAILAGLLTLAFRRNRAQVRYWIWLSASVKFLVPFSLLLTLGSYFGRLPAAQRLPARAIASAMVQVVKPFPQPSLFVPSAQPTADWLPVVIIGLWACGFAGVVSVRLRAWVRIRAAVRASTPLDISFPVPVRCAKHHLEPGVVGIFRPILLLPAGIIERFAPNQLQAILGHELCHVRRRDNLTAAIHMLVEALFWFHPFVWWISSRLMEERERACDENVLELGSEPQNYAESILKTCEFCVESPLACVPGVTGADLKKRVVRIMTQSLANKLSIQRKIALAGTGIATLAVPLIIGVLYTPLLRSQSPQQSSGALPSFEVASIKPNRSADMHFRIVFPPGRFTATGATIKQLITVAWNVKDFQVSGGPSWISSEKYDIDAKEPDSLADELQKLPFDQRLKQMGLTLQSLLADRFKLKVSHATRELPVYALVVAKNGPKLSLSTVPPPSTAGAGSHGGPLVRMQRGQIPEMKATVGALAMVLSQQAELGGRGVLDQTGLEGTYDISLHWSPEQSPAEILSGSGGVNPGTDAATPPDTSGPSLFAALQEQLGLKLERTKGPVQVLVIDHVERPTEN